MYGLAIRVSPNPNKYPQETLANRNNVYMSTTATSAVGHMDNTCGRKNIKKPKAGLYLVSGNTRNKIAVACISYLEQYT